MLYAIVAAIVFGWLLCSHLKRRSDFERVPPWVLIGLPVVWLPVLVVIGLLVIWAAMRLRWANRGER
ncbi:hypothetical protein ACVOMT_11730 [Sphingomonas panni]